MQPLTTDCGANRVGAREGEAFTVLPGSLDLGLLLICDHAANSLPADYGDLGLAPFEFERHIAYDIGAAGVVRQLAALLTVPAVLTRNSRLLIDCNRGSDDPTLIMRISDGAIVPGNRHVDEEERNARLTRFYDPYHDAIARIIDQALAAGVVPVLLSIHSFTPVWRGTPRPWHAAVLWDKDPRLADALMTALAQDAALKIGDNEPYNGRLRGDCMFRHGTERGLPHVLLELRQDLIASAEGQSHWAARLATIMQHILAGPGSNPDLKRQAYYGSHTQT